MGTPKPTRGVCQEHIWCSTGHANKDTKAEGKRCSSADGGVIHAHPQHSLGATRQQNDAMQPTKTKTRKDRNDPRSTQHHPPSKVPGMARGSPSHVSSPNVQQSRDAGRVRLLSTAAAPGGCTGSCRCSHQETEKPQQATTTPDTGTRQFQAAGTLHPHHP